MSSLINKVFHYVDSTSFSCTVQRSPLIEKKNYNVKCGVVDSKNLCFFFFVVVVVVVVFKTHSVLLFRAYLPIDYMYVVSCLVLCG